VSLALALLFASGSAPAQDDPERELARVRSEIDALERDLARQITRRDDGLAALKEIELALAATRAELAALAESVGAKRRRQGEIEAERTTARRNLGDEEAALARQLRMSYMTGRQELVKLLLSQENPADFGRMLVYYDYLNRARGERIAAVNDELAALAALAAENDAVEAELSRLLEAEESELARLDRSLAERRRLVGEIDAAIASGGDRIERMRAEEARLNEVVARLAELLAGFPINSDAPFAEQRGALAWPVEGRIGARFGSLREGGPLVWDGVLLEAEAGSLVRAVYHGQVVLSDWLGALGLVLILDHGDGYLTLYGHNRALLRGRGDWVTPGEPIAEVGDTGGRAQPALYFGIRHDADPVDPVPWFR
jgi:septal ring factor EnvC (AmiA/AmiB activator)